MRSSGWSERKGLRRMKNTRNVNSNSSIGNSTCIADPTSGFSPPISGLENEDDILFLLPITFIDIAE